MDEKFIETGYISSPKLTLEEVENLWKEQPIDWKLVGLWISIGMFIGTSLETVILVIAKWTI